VYPHVPSYSLPPSCSFSHSYTVSSQLWLMPHVFFIPPPSSFQFVSPLTSAFEGRVGTALSQPEISAGVVAEAILLYLCVPTQGHICAPTSPASWHREAGRDGAQTQERYPGNLQGKQVLGLPLLQTKHKCWLFCGL